MAHRAKSPVEPHRLSRERVCKEALALVDEEGLEALTMRRLGARLGVEAMSLYRHVRNKEDLLDALHAAVLGDLRPPDATGAGDWRAQLGGLAHALRAALLRHPNVAVLFASRPITAPEALAPIQSVWAAFARAGFSVDVAYRAVISVGFYTIGHAIGEANGRPAPELGAPYGPGVAEFRFGLEALLDGIARHSPEEAPQ